MGIFNLMFIMNNNAGHLFYNGYIVLITLAINQKNLNIPFPGN